MTWPQTKRAIRADDTMHALALACREAGRAISSGAAPQGYQREAYARFREACEKRGYLAPNAAYDDVLLIIALRA